ncbi:MAG: SAM-dependent methyltransferase [Fibrobacter sp.]|nr:SAM-dependent methyltransferase [Fibrobacter sp.]
MYTVYSIGTINITENGTFIHVDKKYIPALQALDGFSHINVLWWFSDFDDKHSRSIVQTKQPYKGAPETMGIFATRSPIRPNPIAVTTTEIIDINQEKGIIQVTFLDANDGTPILDIKPYTPSLDRVESPSVPAWCSSWPKSTEDSGDCDWEQVFNF